MIIGSHVSMSGKDMLLGSVKEALSYGANTCMFYTGAPQNTRRKAISELMVEEAKALMKDLKDSLHIDCIDNLRLLNRYDIEGLSDEICDSASKTIFSEPNLDVVYKEDVEYDKDAKVFAVEYLPGQYDQRADWAAQCVQIINEGQRPNINSAKLYILTGDIDDELFAKIKSYVINPVDSREASLEKPESLRRLKICSRILPKPRKKKSNYNRNKSFRYLLVRSL